MSATGVKRNGKGYQSDNYTPIAHLAPSSTTVAKPTTRRHQKNLFGTSRKQPMPPPVSSQDWRSSALIDEFGGLSIPIAGATGTALPKSDKQGIVRRALRTIVNGKR